MSIFFMVNPFLCQYKLIAHEVGSKGGDNKENINRQKSDRQMGNAVCCVCMRPMRLRERASSLRKLHLCRHLACCLECVVSLTLAREILFLIIFVLTYKPTWVHMYILFALVYIIYKFLCCCFNAWVIIIT